MMLRYIYDVIRYTNNLMIGEHGDRLGISTQLLLSGTWVKGDDGQDEPVPAMLPKSV